VIKKILIPVEDELFVDEISDFISDLQAASDDLRLRIMHAEIPPASLTALKKGDPDTDSSKLVDAVRTRLKGKFPYQNIETVVVDGTPKEAIIDEARAWDADLILLGPHGVRGLSKLILGSVAASVIPDAPCNVVLMKPLSQMKNGQKEVEKQGVTL
jgi:nucleotide-binding universal stress UspA family protein